MKRRNILPEIKDLGLPKALESELLFYADFVKSTSLKIMNHLLFVGCQEEYLLRILDVVKCETSALDVRFIDGKDYNEPFAEDDFASLLKSFGHNDIVCIKHIDEFNQKVKRLIEQVIFTGDIVLFNGPGEFPYNRRKLYLSPMRFVICVDNIEQLPEDFLRGITRTLDFTKYPIDPTVFRFEGKINDEIQEEIGPMIKDLGLPIKVEEKFISFINRYRTTYSSENMLLIGCPEKYLSRIVEALSNELDVNSQVLDCRAFAKTKQEGEFVAELTKMCDNDVVCFSHIEMLRPESIKALEEGLLTYGVDVTIGKGDYAKKLRLDIGRVNSVIAVDDISQVPQGLLDAFFEIIDFRKHENELRVMLVADFAEKYKLIFSQAAKEMLARKFANDEQLKMQLVEIRNKAYGANINEITESFLQENLEPIPELDKIDEMDGRSFELFTGNLLRENGFENINVTQASYDFGVDVIAEKDDVKYAIQCKRYNGPIGVSAVQEVIASKSLHDCHVACVLTNSSFTPAAVELAKKNLVILWDRKKLQKFINNAKG